MSELTLKELDVRPIPPPEKHPTIFKTFDALAKDEAFVLVNDHDPKPLYYQFHYEREGEFDWTYLERGPEVFRVKITKVNEVEGSTDRDIPEHSCGCGGKH